MKKLLVLGLIWFLSVCAAPFCIGRGICEAPSGTGRAAPEKPNSSFSYDEENEVLKISFNEAQLKLSQPEQAAYLSSNDCYPIDADFTLPEELTKALNAAKPIVVKAGAYPVSYDKGVYTITIELKSPPRINSTSQRGDQKDKKG